MSGKRQIFDLGRYLGEDGKRRRYEYKPLISIERVCELYEVLQSKAPLDDGLRAEIVGALGCLYKMLLIEREAHTVGRPMSFSTNVDALLVLGLVETHKLKVKTAVALVSPDPIMNDRIERAYRKMKSRPRYWESTPETLQRYVDKLAKKAETNTP